MRAHPSPRSHLGVRLASILLALSIIGCGDDRAVAPTVLTVFAAASAGEVLERIAADFAAESGVEIRINAAASSTLARQIGAGAPADLFISAHPEWIDHLVGTGDIARDRTREIARNGLVLVSGPNGPEEVPSHPERIAVGDPAHVPLGRYTQQALIAMGHWETWRDRLLPALDARSAVEYVRRGEAPIGIVYRTDALAHPELRVLFAIDPEDHDPAIVWVAPVGDDPDRSVEAFLAHLVGAAGQRRLREHGFEIEGMDSR